MKSVPELATYADMYLDTVERTPDALALTFPGISLTYGELLERAIVRADQLQVLGVGRGYRFGLLMQNSPELVEFLLGGSLIGAAVVPINTRFESHELAHVIANAELTAVITTGGINGDGRFVELLDKTLGGLAESSQSCALELSEFPALHSVATTSGPPAPGLVGVDQSGEKDLSSVASSRLSPDDPLLIMYTSGTTAQPKGCVLTSGALVRNALAIMERLEITNSDVWWNPLPMFHMGGIMLMSSVLAAGGRFISQPYFNAEDALELIQRERPTVLYPLFPPITLDLIHHDKFASKGLESVRLVGSVAPPDVQARIQQSFPSARLFSAYGITELCGCVAFHRPGDSHEQRLSTCGCALDGFDIRIVDPDTNMPLDADVRGELVGRGEQMFTEYYGAPEATAAAIDSEGFFHTGDICSMSADGQISYHGRLKDMLKVGGENVAAIEVESFLATHPSVKMAQVVGVSDPRLLEVVAAFVELLPGHSLNEEDLVEYCRGRIASFKVPRYVRFITDWPMSATKVQKFRLRDRLLDELYVRQHADN